MARLDTEIAPVCGATPATRVAGLVHPAPC